MGDVLVTGAAGFIGFHVIRRLLEANFHVVGIDDINTYYDVNLKYARLAMLGVFFVERIESCVWAMYWSRVLRDLLVFM